MAEVRAKKVGAKWRGEYNFGGYWFPVKRSFRVVTFGSAKAAREAAETQRPKGFRLKAD
jgi:hypothetical protein